MIRGTKNEGISSLSKRRHVGGGLTYTGTKGQSFETVFRSTDSMVVELRDEFDVHLTLITEFSSNAFNGTFE